MLTVKQQIKKSGRADLESIMDLHLRAAKVPEYVREHQFHATRMWRFDFAWLEHKVALEVEGLTNPQQKSRHTTNKGYTEDARKYNSATLLGWRVFRVTGAMVKSGEALQLIEDALGRGING